MKEISTPCPKCVDGIESVATVTGEIEEITCRTCGGSGLYSNLSLSDELVDKISDMDDKLDDIKEKLDE